jgi:multiple sugar transport system substrate-binding protein
MSEEKKMFVMTRREMLKISGMVAGGAVLAACAPTAPVATEAVVEPTEKPVEAQPTEKPAEEVVPTEAPAKPAGGNVIFMHRRNEWSEDQEKAFVEANPGITVEFVTDDITRFFAMMAAGTPPDLYRTQAPNIPGFLARKLLYDLSPYFETSSVLKMDDLVAANDYYKAESPLKIGTGKIYGMCKDFSPDETLFAYKPALEEAGFTVDDTKPYTAEEVMDIATKTSKFEGDINTHVGYGFETTWIDRFIMNNLAGLGLSLYSEGFDKMNLAANDEARKNAQWYFDLAKNKLMASPINPSPNGWFGTDFTAGIMTLAQYGYWFSAMAESDQNRGMIAMLPAATWGGVRRDLTVTATGMIMLSSSQAPDAAWKLFEWYNGGQPSIDRASSGWGVPALKSQFPLIPQNTDFQKQAYKVLMAELALEASPIQFNPFIGEGVVTDTWNKNLDVALKGEIDFDTMLKNVEADTNLAIMEGIDRIMG